MLAEPANESTYALYRLAVPPETTVPSARPVPDELMALLWSAEGYPPALAMARDAVEHRDVPEPEPDAFLRHYADALRLFLGQQRAAPYFLARAIKDQPGYLTAGAWYWLVGRTPGGKRVGWVSSDYHVYTDSADHFDALPHVTDCLPQSVDPEWCGVGELIYIPLMNEGTDVWAPALGQRVGPLTFHVLRPVDYNPAAEEWEFPPGTTIECARQADAGPPRLVAVRRTGAP